MNRLKLILQIEGDIMAGRRGQPIDILVAKGKKHLTNEEKKRRKEGEIKIGKSKFACPDFVLKDPIALEKWQEIMELYKGADFVSSGDTGHLARYCKTFSEYLKLLDRMDRIKDISENSDDTEDYINDSDEFDYKIKKQLIDMVSTDGVLRIETAINKKQDLLIKMEDRMFLNPLSKVRNVPKEEPEKKDPLKDQGFGNV
jgi:phage terminase small subunit